MRGFPVYYLNRETSTVCEALTVHHCRKCRTAFVKVSQEFYFKQNGPLLLNSWYSLAASVKEVILQQIKTCISLTTRSVCFQLENIEVLLSQSLSKIRKMRDFPDAPVVRTSPFKAGGLFICLAALGLHCCACTFFSCGERELLSSCVTLAAVVGARGL